MWSSEFAFECNDNLTGLLIANDTSCPTAASPESCPQGNESCSVSDKACAPSSTVVGYMGGVGSFPFYYNYTLGGDNYSETVRLEFDGQQTTFADLLDYYWNYLDKAGSNYTVGCTADPGYCLRIYYVDGAQKQAAEASLAKQQSKHADKILVAILPASEYTFWKGEEYHQQRLRKEGIPCSIVPHASRTKKTQGIFFA